jgi:hypothetical protein
MSSRSAYTRLEKAIAAADAGTIRQRWEYGRRLLCDPSATTDAGNLRHGKLAELIDAASRAGVPLSDREIRYRLEAGRAYPCESQIGRARADFSTWNALRDARFPAYDADPGEQPYDPRSLAEKVGQTEKQLALGEPDQLALFEYFPSDLFSELSTLGELRKYQAEMAEWTERQARRDAERLAYVEALSAAVGGDESKTWAEAQAALDADQAE